MNIVSISVISIAIGFGSCVNKAVENSQGEDTMPSQTLEEVLKEHTEKFI